MKQLLSKGAPVPEDTIDVTGMTICDDVETMMSILGKMKELGVREIVVKFSCDTAQATELRRYHLDITGDRR